MIIIAKLLAKASNEKTFMNLTILLISDLPPYAFIIFTALMIINQPLSIGGND